MDFPDPSTPQDIKPWDQVDGILHSSIIIHELFPEMMLSRNGIYPFPSETVTFQTIVGGGGKDFLYTCQFHD